MITSVQDTQDQHGNEPWNNKERPSYYTSRNFVQQPPDVDGKLLRFGSWKKHAVIQGMEKAALTYPPFFFNQISVHNRYLARRSAK